MTKDYLWALITLIIAIILAIILLSVARDSDAPAQSQTPAPPFITASMQEDIRRLAHRGLADAMEDRIKVLFEVWMKDPEADQPRRASNGIRQAISAYVRSYDMINGWSPETCTTVYPPEAGVPTITLPEQKQ